MAKLNFWDTYELLNEYVVSDFDKGDDTTFYHFFSSLNDLLSSLDMGRIYSNKNLRTSQKDPFAEEGYGYVCMTTEREGKRRAAYNFCGPYGISFVDLASLCQSKQPQYTFDPKHPYIGQFLLKNQYTDTKKDSSRSKSDKTKQTLRDFRILAIGELTVDGKPCYFISGGQGRNLTNHWTSKLFYDTDLYNSIYDWFIAKNCTGNSAKKYYHFKDNTFGSPTEIFTVEKVGKRTTKHTDYIINTTGQLNSLYVPWLDSDGVNHYSAVSFTPTTHDVYFKEIWGLGPLRVEDDQGRVLLQLDMVHPNSKGGYSGPTLKTISDVVNTTGEVSFSKEPTFVTSRPASNGRFEGETMQNWLLDEETAKKLAELYNEHEYRVYIPAGRDFYYNPAQIKSIVLPRQLRLTGTTNLDLELLCEDLQKNESGLSKLSNLPADDEELLTCIAPYLIGSLLEALDPQIKALIINLFFLLQGKYSDIDQIEFIGDAPERFRKKIYTGASKSVSLAKQRLVVNSSVVYPDADKAEVVSYSPDSKHRRPSSVVAPLVALSEDRGLSGLNGETARIGVEIIVIGKDAQNNKYVLFVNNDHKATGFLELPGGGFYNTAWFRGTDADYVNLAKHRLQFKAGFNTEFDKTDIIDLCDNKTALILDESKVAKVSSVTWHYSYYRLFTANYDKIISEDSFDYSHDNREQAAQMASDEAGILQVQDESGYTCFLEWVPVATIDLVDNVTGRYKQILPIIKKLIS